MYAFTRVHPYETQEIIVNDILKHFREVSDTHDFIILVWKIVWLRPWQQPGEPVEQ